MEASGTTRRLSLSTEKKIVDFLWADEELGQVMSTTYGPRDHNGFRREHRKLLKGKVKIEHRVAMLSTRDRLGGRAFDP